jgi:hypothetical protein
MNKKKIKGNVQKYNNEASKAAHKDIGWTMRENVGDASTSCDDPLVDTTEALLSEMKTD